MEEIELRKLQKRNKRGSKQMKGETKTDHKNIQKGNKGKSTTLGAELE